MSRQYSILGTFVSDAPLILITSQPANQTVQIGQSATFTVTTSGIGTLHYTWYKNNTVVQSISFNGTDSNSYNTGTVSIGNDNSIIYCVVTDSLGTTNAVSATAILRVGVYVPPARTAVDFKLISYTAPTRANVNFALILPTVGTANNWIKVYLSGTWTYKPVKYYNGSTWVQKPLKHWNGSTWV